MPLFGYTGSLVIEGDLVISSVGGDRAGTIMAFDKGTVQVGWKSLNENVSYSSPVVAPRAGVRQWVVMTGPGDVAGAVGEGKEYGVAREPSRALGAEAYGIGERPSREPTLILAVMAVESSFNPFAQSPVGAQGLMQVMTRVHSDKYESFGGKLAAFDPLTNLRVGARVLMDCIERTGSIEGGLRAYVGAANLPDDGGYATKVLAEHARLQLVVLGHSVPFQSPQTIPVMAPAQPSRESGATLVHFNS